MWWLTCSLALLLSCGLGGCRPARAVSRVEWTAMGTVAAVQGRGDVSLAGARQTAQEAFRRVEAEFSRFDPNSTLRRLGHVSAFGQPCWEAATRLCAASDGAFNPTWRGAGDFDFGAIAKGFAVDVAAEALCGAGDDLLVDLGGNVKAVRGDWTVGVRNPADGGVAAVVALRAGEALATSAEYFRGKHIRDGRTGRPVSNEVASVTVRCPSAMWADGLSTTLFVLGVDSGKRFLRERLPDLVDSNVAVSVLWILRSGCKVWYNTRHGEDEADHVRRDGLRADSCGERLLR